MKEIKAEEVKEVEVTTEENTETEVATEEVKESKLKAFGTKVKSGLLQQLIVDEKLFIERPIRNSQENQQTVRSRITPHLYYPSFHQLNTQFHIRTDIVRFVCMIA